MVRLRLGRFASELYYTRTRAVLPREEVRRRVALVAGHLGYITGLFEYIMTDMLLLRAFALSGCVLIVGYQAAQPKIQKLSAGWNSIFALVNIYHIYLLQRPLPALSEEESVLLSALGERLSLRQFHLLLEAGEWRSFEDSTRLCQEGDCTEHDEVCILANGQCDVLLGGVLVGHLQPGSVVGEVGLVALCSGSAEPSPAATATVVVRGDARCLCLPRARIKGDTGLQEALQGVLAAALAAKVAAMSEQAKALQYSAVVEAATHIPSADAEAAISAALATFRHRHGITEEEHLRISESIVHSLRSRAPGDKEASGSRSGSTAAAAGTAAVGTGSGAGPHKEPAPAATAASAASPDAAGDRLRAAEPAVQGY